MSTTTPTVELVEAEVVLPEPPAADPVEEVMASWEAWLGQIISRRTRAALAQEIAWLLPIHGASACKLALVSVSLSGKALALDAAPRKTAFAFSSAVMRLTSSKAGTKAERARLMAEAAAHAASRAAA